MTDVEKKEIEAVVRNGNAVANNLAGEGKLIASGVISSLMQTVRLLVSQNEELGKDLKTVCEQLADANQAHNAHLERVHAP